MPKDMLVRCFGPWSGKQWETFVVPDQSESHSSKTLPLSILNHFPKRRVKCLPQYCCDLLLSSLQVMLVIFYLTIIIPVYQLCQVSNQAKKNIVKRHAIFLL